MNELKEFKKIICKIIGSKNYDFNFNKYLRQGWINEEHIEQALIEFKGLKGE